MKQPFDGADNVEVFSRPDRIGTAKYYIPFQEAADAAAESGLSIAAFGSPLPDGPSPDAALYTAVSVNFFDVLGVRPQAGRLFQDLDASTPTVAVISDAMWRSIYAGADDVIGRQLTIDRRAYTIIGVAPARFGLPGGTDVWTPIEPRSATAKQIPYRLIGKRPLLMPRPTLVARLHTWSVVSLRDYLRPSEGRQVLVLSVVNGLLLLVIWIHLGLTQVAASISRLSEVRIRIALGGSRWRVMRTSLLDAYATVVICALTGGVLSAPALALLVRRLPPEIVVGRSIGIDSRSLVVLAVVLIIGLIAVTLATIPALFALRTPSGALSSRTTAAAATPIRWIVGLQVSSTTAVIYVLGLAGASMAALEATDLGYRPENVLAIENPQWAPARQSDTRDDSPWISQLQEVVDNLGRLPGVVAVGTSLSRPGLPGGGLQPVWLPESRAEDAVRAEMNIVAGNFFGALQIPVVAGEVFDAPIRRARPVRGWDEMVIDTDLAAALGSNVLGREISIGGFPTKVIGIVGATRLRDPDDARIPRYYLRVSGGLRLAPVILVRYTGSVEVVRPAAIRTVQEAFGAPRPPYVVSLSDELDRLRAPYRGRFEVVSFVGTMAALLTVAGVFGMSAYIVARRRRELAVRLALGASRGQVLWTSIRGPVVSAACAVVVGLLGGIALGRQLSSALYVISPADPWVICGVAALVAAITAAGAMIPARRALAVDVSAVLRDE